MNIRIFEILRVKVKGTEGNLVSSLSLWLAAQD